MSGKRLLTRKQLGSVRQSVLAGVGFRAEHVKELVDHIEIVGMYAPEEPTPAEIAERRARAQGWVTTGVEKDVYRMGNGLHVSVKSYRPAENLMQALDAAATLAEWAILYIDNRDYRVALVLNGERDNSPRDLTPEEAAHWICMRLLKHLENQ